MREPRCYEIFFWQLLKLIGCSPVRFGNFSLLGKALVLAKKGREFGWRLLFVYFGRYGWKGTWWFLKMRPPRLRCTVWITQILWWGFWLGWGIGESVLVFPCTPLVYFLGPLCSSFIYINIAFYRSKIFFLSSYSVSYKREHTLLRRLSKALFHHSITQKTVL